MTKIRLAQLNSHTSRFDILNEAETSKIVGGSSYLYRHNGFNFSAYIYSRFNVKITDIEQMNGNETIQFTFGGNKYSFTDQSKDTSQYNFVLVEQ